MNDMNRRLVAEIPEQLHRNMRVAAARKNITIKDWLMIAIIYYLDKERELSQEV